MITHALKTANGKVSPQLNLLLNRWVSSPVLRPITKNCENKANLSYFRKQPMNPKLIADLKEARRELSKCSGIVKAFWLARLRAVQKQIDKEKK